MNSKQRARSRESAHGFAAGLGGELGDEADAAGVTVHGRVVEPRVALRYPGHRPDPRRGRRRRRHHPAAVVPPRRGALSPRQWPRALLGGEQRRAAEGPPALRQRHAAAVLQRPDMRRCSCPHRRPAASGPARRWSRAELESQGLRRRHCPALSLCGKRRKNAAPAPVVLICVKPQQTKLEIPIRGPLKYPKQIFKKFLGASASSLAKDETDDNFI